MTKDPDREAIRRLVLSRPIPERLIEAIESAPLVELHEVESTAERIISLPRTADRNQFGVFYRDLPRSRGRKRAKNRPDDLLRTRRSKDVPTPRQLRALQLASTGLTYSQIAQAMKCSENTVKDHMRRARLALGAHSTPHAVAIGFRRGLLE